VDELNLAAAGLEADKSGRISVDAEYHTKVPNIFAVGDVIGFPSLASVSMEQGRIAARCGFPASRFRRIRQPIRTASTLFPKSRS